MRFYRISMPFKSYERFKHTHARILKREDVVKTPFQKIGMQPVTSYCWYICGKLIKHFKLRMTCFNSYKFYLNLCLLTSLVVLWANVLFIQSYWLYTRRDHVPTTQQYLTRRTFLFFLFSKTPVEPLNSLDAHHPLLLLPKHLLCLKIFGVYKYLIYLLQFKVYILYKIYKAPKINRFTDKKIS